MEKMETELSIGMEDEIMHTIYDEFDTSIVVCAEPKDHNDHSSVSGEIMAVIVLVEFIEE